MPEATFFNPTPMSHFRRCTVCECDLSYRDATGDPVQHFRWAKRTECAKAFYHETTHADNLLICLNRDPDIRTIFSELGGIKHNAATLLILDWLVRRYAIAFSARTMSALSYCAQATTSDLTTQSKPCLEF